MIYRVTLKRGRGVKSLWFEASDFDQCCEKYSVWSLKPIHSKWFNWPITSIEQQLPDGAWIPVE